MTLTRRAVLGTAATLAFGSVLATEARAAVPAPTRRPEPAAGLRTGLPARQIPLQGAHNVRDLGGHRGFNGRTVRAGCVLRADSLSQLTEADVRTLGQLGLGSAVDFRVPYEVQADGADRLPGGVRPVQRSVEDGGLYQMMREVIASRDPVRQEAALGGGKAEETMRAVYRRFVHLASARQQFADTLRDLGKSRSPLLYHCTAGKDRTGWMSYVVLLLLGVDRQTAERDYLLSNSLLAESSARTRAGLKQAGLMQNPDLLIPLQEVRSDYLGAALDQLRADYGTFDAYIRRGLGFTRGDQALLCARLLR